MKELLIIVALAHGADTATSLYGFSKGAAETNPIILSQKPVPFSLQMAAGAGLEMYALAKLAPSHPKLAKVLGYVTVGLRGSVAAHNVMVARGMQK